MGASKYMAMMTKAGGGTSALVPLLLAPSASSGGAEHGARSRVCPTWLFMILLCVCTCATSVPGGSPITQALKVIAAYGLIQGMTSDLVRAHPTPPELPSDRNPRVRQPA